MVFFPLYLVCYCKFSGTIKVQEQHIYTNKYIAWEVVAKTGISGATNLVPSNPELLKRVNLQLIEIKQTGFPPLSDLVYTSVSGLDPHITVRAALAQIERVACSRNLPP